MNKDNPPDAYLAALSAVGPTARKAHMYEVTYTVTRDETYRVTADDEDEAKATAFFEGQKINVSEAYDVETPLGFVKQIPYS